MRAAALKHILRSMHRMMQSSGTAEGLRGLIDSSLLKSIKKIIEHRSLFGPNVLPIGTILALFMWCSLTELLLAINILATFVHNEPTSLTVIQEAGVPEAFYRAVEAGLEPVIEVYERRISPSCRVDVYPGNPSHPQRNWRLMSQSSWPRPAHRATYHHPGLVFDLYLGATPTRSSG